MEVFLHTLYILLSLMIHLNKKNWQKKNFSIQYCWQTRCLQGVHVNYSDLEEKNIPGHEPLLPAALHLLLQAQGVRQVTDVVALQIINVWRRHARPAHLEEKSVPGHELLLHGLLSGLVEGQRVGDVAWSVALVKVVSMRCIKNGLLYMNSTSTILEYF